MKLWKKMVLIPYMLIGLWLIISILTTYSGNIGGVFIGAAFLSVGIMFALGYSILLGFALLLRYIIIRIKNKN